MREEKQLKDLVNAGSSLKVIATQLKKSREAVKVKMQRLGLKVVVVPVKKNGGTTTTFDLPVPDDLPSIEMQLRVLAGVIKKLAGGRS